MTTTVQVFPKASSPASRVLPAVIVAVVIGVLTADFIIAGAVLLLWAAWVYLQEEGIPPVLPLAFSFQWLQVVVGLLYFDVTGRQVRGMRFTDPRPMVMVALVGLTALLVGLRLGMNLGRQTRRAERPRSPEISWRTIIIIYVVTTATSGLVQQFAYQYSGLTQGVMALGVARLAVLFLMLRRLVRPPARWSFVVGLVLFEVALGITAYFATFREALMMTALALIEVFDRKKISHWVGMGLTVVMILATGLLWTNIKGGFRQSFRKEEEFASSQGARFERIQELSADWASRSADEMAVDLDRMVDRLWAIPYQALVLPRVPSIVPYEDGALTGAAVKHVFTPRAFFPDKEDLPSDSDAVRKYSGVMVAGARQNTTIAFGYMIESYVDFGYLGMWFPVLVFGLVMGVIYRMMRRSIHNDELSAATVTAVFWLSLYSYERSWARTLGRGFTMILFLGGAMAVADRLLRLSLARSRAKNGA